MKNQKLQRLTDLANEISDINMSAALLGWDQETYKPKAGIRDRAEQLSTLSKISHEKFTSQEMGELISDCSETAVFLQKS